MQVLRISLLASALIVLTLPGCRFTSDSESVVISGDYPIAYIKHRRDALNPDIDSKLSIIGSDLFLRKLPSPDAEEINLTRNLTNGKGMVADPDVSFDGNRVVFSVRCTSESSDRCRDDSSWSIWIYDRRDGSLERAIDAFDTAKKADDIDPAFLTNNKIIFSSTRQKKTVEKDCYQTLPKTCYQYADEDQKNLASALHTLDLDTQVIEQISFNRSHDRNPSVMQNGKIMFNRWDRIGGRNQITIYSANPDGTDMNVLYGAHSPGEAFLHPKELPDSRILSTVLPLTGTWEGGALMVIDSKNYSDANSPAPGVLDKSLSGQQAASIQKIPIDQSVSLQGRFTTPYPLYDGSNQVLVGYSFFQQIPAAVSIYSSDLEKLEATPHYGIYMFDMEDKSLKPIVLPDDESVITDPVAFYPRAEPPDIQYLPFENPGVFSPNDVEGIVNVKSVYDTDKFERMGQGVLTVDENVLTPIPLIASADQMTDNREYVADLLRIKDPLQTLADQRPARFVRVTKSIPTPPGLLQQVIGLTSHEMQQLIGYAPIEPDGSFKVKVPADTPIALTVLDKYGRAFESHTNWMQVRPGETLTCNGCHSPGRTEALNRVPVAGNNPNTNFQNGVVPLQNETMAETRTRIDKTALELNADIKFDDVWTNTSLRNPDLPINYSYANLQTPAPINGIINYPDHIQPIWELPRNANGASRSCVSCHNGSKNAATNPTGLNLNGFVGGSGRNYSYDSLLTGREVYDEKGLPYFEYVGSVLMLKKGLPLVAAGFSRGSHLIEVLFDQELFAEKSLKVSHQKHSDMLTNSEKKLVIEWIDLGAQFFNNPFDEDGKLRALTNKLDYNYFANKLHDQLVVNCATCHSPVTIDKVTVNSRYQESGYVLMRDKLGDYGRTINMVTDLLVPTNSAIVSFPSDVSGIHNIYHDNNNRVPEASMPVGSAFYNDVISWIQGAKQ